MTRTCKKFRTSNHRSFVLGRCTGISA